jgi:two-component system cell cycle sensor histidine kinase/response regulator CckA
MSDTAKTILLVEDEELFRGMLADILRFDDYTVLEAGNGDEAVFVAGSHPAPIHLIVTDINLHGMTGIELTDQLVQRHPSLGIIYMSGDTLSAAVGDGKVRDGAQFLQKPFDSTAFLDKVRETLQTT